VLSFLRKASGGQSGARVKSVGVCHRASACRISSNEAADANGPTPRKAGKHVGLWEEAMNWFSQTTSIGGMQVSNWILAIMAAVALWMIYSAFIH
jgi:hypothetical protein